MKKSTVLSMVGIAIVAYLLGAYTGFPLVEMDETTGSINRAKKQRELIVSPETVVLAERFQTDSVYRQQMIDDLSFLLLHSEATRVTIDSLVQQIEAVPELQEYAAPLNEVSNVSSQLSARLINGLIALQDVSTENAGQLSNDISQSLNAMFIMNAKMGNLKGFNEKVGKMLQANAAMDAGLKRMVKFLSIEQATAIMFNDTEKLASINKLGMNVNDLSNSYDNALKSGAVSAGHSIKNLADSRLNNQNDALRGVSNDMNNIEAAKLGSEATILQGVSNGVSNVLESINRDASLRNNDVSLRNSDAAGLNNNMRTNTLGTRQLAAMNVAELNNNMQTNTLGFFKGVAAVENLSNAALNANSMYNTSQDGALRQSDNSLRVTIKR